MKTTIVCKSIAHGNTRRIANAIGEVLDARIIDPDDVDPGSLAAGDLIGFGSGIYYLRFHRELRRFVQSLPAGQRAKAFVFTTSGFHPVTGPMERLLESKGFDVVGTFSCRAFDDWSVLSLVGGVNKGRPDASDLAAARDFAVGLRNRLSAF